MEKEAISCAYCGAASQCISVKDRLPEPDQRMRYSFYLAIHAGWDEHWRILMFDNVDLIWTRDGDDTQKVTHWMPLPRKPLTNKGN